MITCCCVKIYVIILLIILALIPIAIIFIYNPELLGVENKNNSTLMVEVKAKTDEILFSKHKETQGNKIFPMIYSMCNIIFSMYFRFSDDLEFGT